MLSKLFHPSWQRHEDPHVRAILKYIYDGQKTERRAARQELWRQFLTPSEWDWDEHFRAIGMITVITLIGCMLSYCGLSGGGYGRYTADMYDLYTDYGNE